MSDLISRSELLHYMKSTELSQYIDEVNKGNDNYNSTNRNSQAGQCI